MRPLDWLLVVLLAAAFAPAALALAHVWSSTDYYSHGFFVPMVSLWLAARRSGAPAAVGRRDARGFAAVALALALYGTGVGLGSVALQGVALVAAVAGVVLALAGTTALRRHAFAVAFLLFMVPVPPAWLNPVILALQLRVSEAAGAILAGAGLGLVRDGNVLTLAGGESLFVAEACSGITSIVTLAPLAVLLAFLSERSWPARLTIVAAVVPVAMLGNLVRVLATVAAADAFGTERVTENLLHDAAGLVIFAVGCGVLIGLAAVLASGRKEVHRAG